MGDHAARVADPWGVLLTRLFDHELVKLLFEADAVILGKASAALVLYDHLRSFMTLKNVVKSTEPQSDALRHAHEALLNVTARLFMTAHQALVNHGHRDSPARTTRSRWLGRQQKVVAPTKEFLLEWQLVRLKVARHRLVMELADVWERDERLFDSLRLPAALRQEVESARIRVSEVWKALPVGRSQPSAFEGVGGQIPG